MDFKEIIADLVHKESGVDKNIIVKIIEIPPDPKLGDYSLPCFIFAKQLKKSPQNIALELKDKLNMINLKQDHRHFELINNVGAYINFFVNKQLLIKNILTKIMHEKECYGSKEPQKSVVLIESPGPNTNKPLHLGHLRNMLLGQCLYDILKFQGKDAHIVNVVNDRGVHICKSMLAYQKYGQGKTPESTNTKPDHFVGDYYVMYQNLEKENPGIEKDIQEMLVKWEDDDLETRKLWRKMNLWCLEGFEQTYQKLDFKIEREYFESETYMHGKEIIIDGWKNKLFDMDENKAIIINLEDQGLGKKVLLRSDSTSVYITQDIFMAKKRFDDYRFDEMYYIVGNEQEHHFKVLFEVFKRLGWKFSEKCYHFSYGMVELPEGKMKSREGTVIDTDDLIDSVIKIAKDEVAKRYDALSDEEIDKRSRIIAMSAIRFFFLKFDPLRNFVFNPKESLAFDGETGPYIEYSYARINSIFRKLGEDIEGYIKDADISLLNEKNEFELAKILANYPKIIDQAARELKPSLIAHYVLGLAQSFNEFYHANPILISEEKLRKARLYLIYCIQLVMKSAMKLMHIEEIDEM